MSYTSSRSRAGRARTAALSLTLTLVILAPGCAGGGQSESARASAAAQTAKTVVDGEGHEVIDAPVLPDPTPATPYSGALPADLKYFEGDADSLLRFTRRKAWYGWERRRRCTGNPNCKDDAPVGWMRAQAIHDAHQIQLGRVPANGLLIGRLINVGAYTDAATEIPAGRHFFDEYYIVLKPRDQNTAELWIGKLSFNPGTGRPSFEAVAAESPFGQCDTHANFRAQADFKNCPARSDGARTFDTQLGLGWFSCSGGCCSSQWPPLVRKWIRDRSQVTPTAGRGGRDSS